MNRKWLGFVGFGVAFLFVWNSKPPGTIPRQAPRSPVVNTLPDLRYAVSRLKPLQTPVDKPQPGDWLAEHKENGQTFEQFVKRYPEPTPSSLSTLYIQPIGDFGPTQQKLVDTTARCLGLFYGRPVKTVPTISLTQIPQDARRVAEDTQQTQILTSYVLDMILKPKRPQDALAVLALSAEDLWPGKGWNFVFGQASLSERVGVWSIQRFGDPDESGEAYQLCLERTLGTALHETGHMLGIPHCIAHKCGMNGSNSLPESDRGTLYFCAECQPKVWWTCNLKPQKHLEELIKFAKDENLDDAALYWQQALETLQRPAKK